MSTITPMLLRLFGTPQLRVNKIPVEIKRRKALAILIYLAVSQQTLSREALAAMFWRDVETSKALAYLRTALWSVGKVIGQNWLVTIGDTLAFNTEANLHIDVEQVKMLYADVMTNTALTPETTLRKLSQIAELYTDDFLAGFILEDSPDFEDWVYFVRYNLRQMLAISLERLVEQWVNLRDYETALPFARRWAALDSFLEAPRRMLMKLYAWQEQYAAAHREYQELERLLQSELGTAPAAETVTLFEAIRTRTLTSPAAPPSPTQTATPIPAVRNTVIHLPPQSTPFIGRAMELQAILDQLRNPDCRLLTLVGEGGSGKTRLSIEAARAYAETTPQSAYFVSLVGIESVEFLVPTIARALAVESKDEGQLWEMLVNALRNTACVLVLDNFEHLLAGAEYLAALIHQAPQIKLIVTSRERLNLQEEWLILTDGLAFPKTLHDPNPAEFPAVQLFVVCAQRIQRSFSLNPANLPDVARICQLVHGLPLAIELAATWIPVLSCAEIAREVQACFDFLATDLRNIPERHRSMRAVMDYSWSRISPDLQTQFARLSIFHGVFTLEAAQAVAQISLRSLLNLVSASLVRRYIDGGFEIHELLRQFAAEKMKTEAYDALLDRYLSYYADFLHAQLKRLYGAQQPEALRAIHETFDNIRSMWYEAVKQRRWVDIQHAYEALWCYTAIRDSFQEMYQMARAACDALRAESSPTTQRLFAALLTIQGWAALWVGSRQEFEGLVHESLAIINALPDHPDSALPLALIAFGKRLETDSITLIQRSLAIYKANLPENHKLYALWVKAFILQEAIQYEQSSQVAQESLVLARRYGNDWGAASLLDLLADNADTVGNYLQAKLYLEDAIPHIERLNNPNWLRWLRNNITYLRDPIGGATEWMAILQEQLQRFEQNGDRLQYTFTLYAMAWRYLEMGDHAFDALHYVQRAVEGFKQLGYRENLAWAYITQGMAALELGDVAQAQRMAHHAFQVFDDMKALEGRYFPWAVAGTEFLLGDIARAEKNPTEALERFQSAVRIAYEIQSMLQTIRHLGGIADWLVDQGRYEEGVALAQFLHDYPARNAHTVHRNARTLAAAAPHLSPEAFEAAKAHGTTFQLPQVIAAALRETVNIPLPD